MEIIGAVVEWLCGLAAAVVEMFPPADTGPLVEAVAPAGRLIGWVVQLNEAFPVVEALAGMGLLAGVYVGVLTFGMIRKAFSLIWPGAGS